MIQLFLDKNGRLRSGWRAAMFLIIFAFAGAFFSTVTTTVLASMGISASSHYKLVLGLSNLSFVFLALATGWLCSRLFEQLPFRSLGAFFTNGWLFHLSIGLLFGAAALIFAVAIGTSFGGLRFEFNNQAGFSAILKSGASSLIVFGVAAAFEEALFRGYILQTFSRSGLAWLAILLTSVFFGFAHLDNPNATWISTANTILAGLWFSVAYLKTRDLWFVWGVHWMWNWVQGSMFGIEVSGWTQINGFPLLLEIDSGPTWLTGQTYGIEGGIACTIGILASLAAIYFAPQLKPDAELLTMTSPIINTNHTD